MYIRARAATHAEWYLQISQSWLAAVAPGGTGGDEEPRDPLLVTAALFLACCGGALHGIAMAIRKHYGEGNDKYYLDWRWWIGTWTDGIAGVMIWPAMPFVSVQLLMPLVVVVQVIASYLLGLLYFGESSTVWSHTGILCAILGVIGLSLSNPHHAAHFAIDNFFVQWFTQAVILTTLGSWAVLGFTRMVAVGSTFWALVAAWLEGIQFITSRAIADATYEGKLESHFTTVLCVCLLKGFCILAILYTQQLGLDQDLSRFAGIYLVACVFFICIYGAAYFGDSVEINIKFVMSATSTLVGIYLLNEHVHKAPECGDDKTASEYANGATPENKASSS